jgi:hypothetical protein
MKKASNQTTVRPFFLLVVFQEFFFSNLRSVGRNKKKETPETLVTLAQPRCRIFAATRLFIVEKVKSQGTVLQTRI